MEPKLFAALLILMTVASSLLIATPAKAQEVPKPSVPQFSVQYVDHSYDVPLTYTTSTDPFTGKEIKTPQGGYHVVNKTIEVTIKNQPLIEVNVNGSTVGLHYQIQIKGHFTDWNNTISSKVYPAINSGCTVIIPEMGSTHLKAGDQVDFRVKAVMGYYYNYFGDHIFPIGIAFETVEEGDWSGTQTLTFGNPVAPTVTPVTTAPPAPATPTPTAAPTNPPQTPTAVPDQLDSQITDNLEKEVTIIIVLAVVAAALVTLFYMRRRTSQ